MPPTSKTLAVISPDEPTAKRLVEAYKQYFDEVVVHLAPNTKDFAKARNEMVKKIRTPYYMWLDTDDDLLNPEKISELVEMMELENIDAVYIPYYYGYNEEGECIALHWREQIIRTSHPFRWVGKVHETLLSNESPVLLKDDRVIRKHAYKSPKEVMNTVLRNHKILEKAVKVKNPDPRNLYYLGRSYFMLEKFPQSAQTLLEYTKVSGWDEQKYDAWMKIGDSLLMMDEHERSINANLEAIKLMPHFPDAYLKLGDLYLHLEQPGRAIQWLQTGLKKPKPETLEIIDPTQYTYRPKVSMALSYFGLAMIDKAKYWIDEAGKYKPKSKMFESAYKAITTAYLEELAIKNAALIGKFVEGQGKVKEYIDGLPPFIKNDLRLRPLRLQAYPSKKWPKKSIVFYCGEQWEDWGPDTLEKGMGGSEEAVVYLSRELAKLGWQVTVYNQRVEEYVEAYAESVGWLQKTIPLEASTKVTYKPWETFNPEDEFDVFVAWRNPRLPSAWKIKARIKAIDFHDTPVGHQNVTEKSLEAIDLCFFKSDFQRKMAPHVPEEKAVVISNGLVPEQFKNPGIKRNPHKVIYASSADRGLDVLVRDVWPEVLKGVPDAELVWPYGWNSYDGMHKGDAEHGRWKWELKRDMFNLGVKELGRLSHEGLAQEMMSCSVWAYPTSFPEINCITALKMQASGVQPITSGYAALQETVFPPEKDIEDIHDKPEELKKFTERLVEALKSPLSEDARQKTAKAVLSKYQWSKIAKEWNDVLEG